jgi:predicted metalloprotease
MQAVTEGYGTPAIYYALAHESGHDVQLQLGITWSGTRSVERELEADCMAGAFLRSYVDAGEMSESDFFILLDLANFIGDPPGVTASDDRSHGMGSQRVAMLLRGYYNDVDGCGTFEEAEGEED